MDWSQAALTLVVLNSVVQCFPDVLYLIEVIDDAVRLLAPGEALLSETSRICNPYQPSTAPFS